VVATLCRIDLSRGVMLEPEHTVGRSGDSRLRIPAGYVSTQHAVIRWTGHRWELRDLGSTNGTFLDGERLRVGESRPLAAGNQVIFGHTGEAWQLADVEPPRPFVVPEDGGPPLLVEDDMLGLPSPADGDVAATIYRSAGGDWKLERADDVVADLAPGKVFEVAGRSYRFSCPAVIPRTSTADRRPELPDARLLFRVTRDEEHVEIELDDGSGPRALPVRNHNYVLLILARRRLDDAAAGHAPSACGWMFKDDLLRAGQMAPPQLNIEVFRIREQFAALGLAGSARIVERRPGTRELRIGVARLEVGWI
jgi:hypothetical protein